MTIGRRAIEISSPKETRNQNVKYFLLGLASLLLGLLLYLLFRPRTHISVFVLRLLPFDIPKAFSTADIPFFTFYLADYLWAFSLSCWLRCIFIDKSQNLLRLAIVSLAGTTYEILQYLDIISGTGDAWDCLLYLLAGCTVNILSKI
ncbi:MAG: hypothetical protein IJ285_02520 [Clostridia bacterium]|nr:hypothetical protein [Clostridia bacterium]